MFYTLAGPEIAVATTKAYSTQLIAAYCLALQFAYVRGQVELSEYESLISELETIPEKIEKRLTLGAPGPEVMNKVIGLYDEYMKDNQKL